MGKLSDVLKIGDSITVYNQRGSNWRLPVLEIDDSDSAVKLDMSKLRNAQNYGWFGAKVSRKGIAYAEG